MSYTSDECVKCFIGGSRFDFDNEKGSEDETMRIYDDKENEVIKENWEQEEQANRQWGEDEHGEGYVDDKGANNSNIVGRCRS